MTYYDTLIFELSKKNRIGYHFKKENFKDVRLPEHLLRDDEPILPEVSEFDVVRHYTKV